MSFDVYRSVGPNVSVSLFGDAAAQGAALGKAIPNFVTSAIEGAQEGYKYSQEAEARSQESEIRQHAIDRMEETDHAQDVQTQNNESIAKINELKAQVAQQNFDLSAEADAAQLTNERDKNQQIIALRNKANQFAEQFSSASPQDQAQMVISGKYADIFAADKSIFTTAGSTVFANQANGLDTATRENLGRALHVTRTQDWYQQKAAKDLDKFNAARDAAGATPLTNLLYKSGKLSIPAEQYATALQFFPADSVLTDSSGAALKNPDGSFMLNPTPEVESKDRFDVFGPDDVRVYSGKNDVNNITGKANDAYSEYAKLLSYQNGEQMELAISQTTKPKGQTQVQQASPTGVQTFNTPAVAGPEVTVKRDPLSSAIQSKFRVSDADFAAIATPVSNLREQIAFYARSPGARSSPAAITTMNNTKERIVRGIAASEFKADPTLKKEYNPEAVQKWNDSVRSKLARIQSIQVNSRIASLGLGGAIGMNIFDPLSAQFNALYNISKVNSPEDLYFKNQQSKLEAELNALIKGMGEREIAKVEQPINYQVQRDNRNSFLSKNASGQR